jgi:hypothetical protein
MKKQLIIAGLLALTLAAGTCLAEEPTEPAKFYKLEFVVKESAGNKVLNSRSYTTMISTGIHSRGEIRAGSKIPYAVSTSNSNWQQIDVGVNVDVRAITEMQDKLAFNIVAEISSVPEGASDQPRPTIRQNRWSSDVVVPLKKPTLLFSSENIDAKTQMQVEVTVTPVP